MCRYYTGLEFCRSMLWQTFPFTSQTALPMTSVLLALALVFTIDGPDGPNSRPFPSTIDGGVLSDSATVLPEHTSLPSWNLVPTRGSRGQFWTNVGFGVISEQYDHNQDIQDLGDQVPLPSSLAELAASLGVTLPAGVDGTVQGHSARVTGTMNVVNVHVGASYDVISRPSYRLALGADLGFSQHNFQAERTTIDVKNATVSIPAYGYENVPLVTVAEQMSLQIPTSLPTDVQVKSGFEAQSMTLFGELKMSAISARLGYHFDVGPDPDASNSRRENTDRQNAVLLGTSARLPLGAIALFGGVDAYLTQKNEANNLTYDQGNLYGVNGGFGYDLGFGEIGAAVTFRYRTEGTTVIAVGDQAFNATRPSGYHIGIAPYINVSPNSAPFSLYVKGGVQDEYRDYTVSLAGESDFAPHMGATVGLVYGF